MKTSDFIEKTNIVYNTYHILSYLWRQSRSVEIFMIIWRDCTQEKAKFHSISHEKSISITKCAPLVWNPYSSRLWIEYAYEWRQHRAQMIRMGVKTHIFVFNIQCIVITLCIQKLVYTTIRYLKCTTVPGSRAFETPIKCLKLPLDTSVLITITSKWSSICLFVWCIHRFCSKELQLIYSIWPIGQISTNICSPLMYTHSSTAVKLRWFLIAALRSVLKIHLIWNVFACIDYMPCILVIYAEL